jgi:hypothetical protein
MGVIGLGGNSLSGPILTKISWYNKVVFGSREEQS